MPKDDQYNPKGNTHIRFLLHRVVSHNSLFLTYFAVRIQCLTEITDGNSTSSDVILADQSKACSRLRILSFSHFLTHPALNLTEHRTKTTTPQNLLLSYSFVFLSYLLSNFRRILSCFLSGSMPV